MKAHLMALGVGIWQSVLADYDVLDSPPTDLHGRKIYENNAKAVDVLLLGLTKTEFVKVMNCKSAKQIWDKLQNIYQGDLRYKEQNFKSTKVSMKA